MVSATAMPSRSRPPVSAKPVPAAPPAADNLPMLLELLDDAKAEKVVSLDLAGKTSIADHMVLASGRSDRHVGAIAERLISGCKDAGVKNIRVEGMPVCEWVLIDTGDIIIHVFKPEAREFYNLEKIWGGDRPSEKLA
jgi:ribosome-associated protein